MAQKTTTATAVEEKKKEGFWSTKITGVSLPLYLIMVLVLIIAMALGKLPTNMIGPIAVLVIFGNLFHFCLCRDCYIWDLTCVCSKIHRKLCQQYGLFRILYCCLDYW